jgi:transcriptional regulator with XRE-family HTH domain
MARLAGLTKTQISRIENGKRAFTSDYLLDFQQAVGCPDIWTPLARAPDGVDGIRVQWRSDAEIEAMMFETARVRRKRERELKKQP